MQDQITVPHTSECARSGEGSVIGRLRHPEAPLLRGLIRAGIIPQERLPGCELRMGVYGARVIPLQADRVTRELTEDQHRNPLRSPDRLIPVLEPEFERGAARHRPVTGGDVDPGHDPAARVRPEPDPARIRLPGPNEPREGPLSVPAGLGSHQHPVTPLMLRRPFQNHPAPEQRAAPEPAQPHPAPPSLRPP